VVLQIQRLTQPSLLGLFCPPLPAHGQENFFPLFFFSLVWLRIMSRACIGTGSGKAASYDNAGGCCAITMITSFINLFSGRDCGRADDAYHHRARRDVGLVGAGLYNESGPSMLPAHHTPSTPLSGSSTDPCAQYLRCARTHTRTCTSFSIKRPPASPATSRSSQSSESPAFKRLRNQPFPRVWLVPRSQFPLQPRPR